MIGVSSALVTGLQIVLPFRSGGQPNVMKCSRDLHVSAYDKGPVTEYT